jgi:hypothetical protein
MVSMATYESISVVMSGCLLADKIMNVSEASHCLHGSDCHSVWLFNVC